MPQVLRFRTIWGVPPGDNYSHWKQWFPTLKEQGYFGVEIDYSPFPVEDFPTIRKIADDAGLEISVLIHTGWKYEPPRPHLTPAGVVDDYRHQLQICQTLRPFNYNTHSGCDHWTLDEAVEFFEGTIKVDAELGLAGRVRHETHRLRALFNPYASAHILKKVPQLRITADISHWVVVCERLLDQSPQDREILQAIIPHVSHIHARMGTTQSSQCPDPTHPVFEPERKFFENFWKECIKAHKSDEPITWVPEYGPYPYHPFGAARDFSEVADTEGKRLQVLFEEWANGN